MIKVNLKGRTGNQLFQIAFAMLIRRSNKELLIVKCTSHFGYWLDMFEINFLCNTHFPNSITLFLNKVAYLICSHDLVIDGNACLNSNIQSRPISNNILIDGFFQDGVSFTGKSQFFFELFPIRKRYLNKFNRIFNKYEKGKLLVVNFRLKEYKAAYFEEIGSTGHLSKDWYIRVLNKINLKEYSHHIVISDDIEDARNLYFDLLINPIFIDEDYSVDFQFLMHGDCVVIPNSSFSWWGAFLNQKTDKLVYAPYNWVGINAGIEYPKGIMIDEFIWVK